MTDEMTNDKTTLKSLNVLLSPELSACEIQLALIQGPYATTEGKITGFGTRHREVLYDRTDLERVYLRQSHLRLFR